MRNPYKLYRPRSELKRVSCQVDPEDWALIAAHMPQHGSTDRFLSTLLQKVIPLILPELPTIPNHESIAALESAIARLTLTPTR